MANIVAADVSAKILSKTPVYEGTFPGSPRRLMMVTVGITVDPGTTDAYPTGGIPLDNLFTKDNASDTGLDTNETIIQVGPALLRAAEGTLTPALPAYFYKGGVAASDCTLVVMNVLADGGTNPTSLIEHANSDITAAAAAGGIGGDTDPYCELTLIGRLRNDVAFDK